MWKGDGKKAKPKNKSILIHDLIRMVHVNLYEYTYLLCNIFKNELLRENRGGEQCGSLRYVFSI